MHVANLQQQIEWEKELTQRGVMRYNDNQQRLRNSGEADKCDGAQYLLKDRLLEVADHLKALSLVARGRGAKFTKLLRQVTPEEEDFQKIAFIGIQVLFQKTQMEKHNTLVKTSIEIGRRIEADLKCRIFEAKYPAYYFTLTKSLKEQNVSDYMHKHKVYMQMFNKFEDLEWTPLDPQVQAQLGLRVLDGVLKVFSDLVVKRKVTSYGIKTVWKVFTTPAFDEWVNAFENARALLDPSRLPCKIPPRAWDDTGNGGYYTHEMFSQTRFIKTKSKEHRNFTKQHDPVKHRNAVNAMQRTPWTVNTRVLDVQQEMYNRGLGVGIPSNITVPVPTFPQHLADIPKECLTDAQKEEVVAWKLLAKVAYGREKKRQSAVIAFMQSYKTAQELRSWEKFYYVYTCDFRGRIYCATSGLSPQGADTAKGLLKFATPVRLGHDGIKWLAIQGANTYGVDKVSYADRVAWVKEHRGHIQRTVDDPIGSRAWWGEADKPYQFLAFCFEWEAARFGDNPNAFSSIPVGLDGSCNGLQHFSAMLKDAVGARATNLMECDKPEDIYKDVADRCARILTTVDDPRARKWLQVGLTRKLAKRPVMTLPYGSTQTSARDYIFEWAQDYWKDFDLDDKHCWDYSKFLTPYLWSAIGGTVTAATSAMAWLKKNVGKEYCKWLTPIGFPVYQFYKDVPVIVVKTKLCGGVRLQLKVQDYDCYGEPKGSQQRSGIAPNFVHSIDSTHMVMTINATDFKCYAMIHDDFGTHAGNTEVLFKAIRTSFHNLYTKHEPLRDWGEQVGADLTTLPKTGEYNINDITNASYFFG